MDFTFNESQEAVRDLAERIFTGHAPVDRVREVERSEDRFDRRLWSELAAAGLIGIALPESDGGAGLGITEMCLVLEQQGRRVAPVPLLWTMVGGLTIAAFGDDELRRSWLPGVIAGEIVLTAALGEGGAGDPLAPSVELAGDGTLHGHKPSVPWAHVASRVLVPARSAGGVVLTLVDPRGSGVTLETGEATDRQLLSQLTFEGAPADLVAGPDAGVAATRWMLHRALTGLAAIQLGVASEALAMAAEYTSNRLQFGKPLSSFQSTSAKAADAYIDAQAMAATLWQAAWRLDSGLDASMAVEVAKWWASEAGQRVVHATQHMHGGMGADIDYPVHRYFLWGKQIEATLGGGSAHLAEIGKALAGARQ
jgi:3-oxocholest-4-en-26-oyl-CoA dehydrogenase beta subunit